MLSELWRTSGIRVVAGGVVAGFHCTHYRHFHCSFFFQIQNLHIDGHDCEIYTPCCNDYLKIFNSEFYYTLCAVCFIETF